MVKDIRFVNSNASVGFDGISCDFPSIPNLLAHLDRLGIDSALTWPRSAIPCVAAGNKRFLKSLEDASQAKGRIFPSLAVAPAMLYEKGAMDELTGLMGQHGIRAIRALPEAMYYEAMQLEPLLEKIRHLKPSIFLNIGEIKNIRSFIALSERFPEMAFVLTNGMWGHMVTLFDLMKRRSNVFAETSWMHTEGTIKLLVKEFGAERILFGADLRSHNAASIAGLIHSGISHEDKKLIAGENLVVMLGLKPGKPCRMGKEKGGALWEEFISGKKLSVPVVDAHTHIEVSSRWVSEESDPGVVVRKMLKNMDSIGIEKSISFPGSAMGEGPVESNLRLKKILKPYRSRFAGCLSFHPLFWEELSEKLDEFFSDGFFAGFKILCDYWKVPVTDERFTPAWEYADKHRLIIMVHTWGGIYNSPGQLSSIVKKYPGAHFLLGHSGGNNAGRREAEELAAGNLNVYLEWCGSFCSSALWEETIDKVGKEKILFGSDAYPHSIHWELGRFLSLGIPRKDMAPILGGNIKKLLARRK